MLIEDGLGNGFSAGVEKTNRLLTSSVTLDAIDDAGQRGLAYNLTTDVVSLTNTAESAVLYIMNTNPLQNLNLLRIYYSFGKATTTGDVIGRVYLNPTAGTLLTNGTPLTFQQRNLGSRYVAQGTAIRMSAVGQTLTGGSLAAVRIYQDAETHEVLSGFIIPAGSALGVTIQPPTGNTNMRCSITCALFYLDRK